MTHETIMWLQDSSRSSIDRSVFGRLAAPGLVMAMLLGLWIGAPCGARADDPLDTAEAKSLDELDEATPGNPNNEDLAWTPAKCPEGPVEVETPSDTSVAGWEAAMAASLSRVNSLAETVDNVTERYAGTLDRAAIQPTERVELGEKRDAARGQYSESRCEFLALKEAARDAGVLPGVLRKFELPPTGAAADQF